MMAANDQILCLGGSHLTESRLRVGISSILATRLIAQTSPIELRSIHVEVATSQEIEHALIEGHLDVGCFFVLGNLNPELRTCVIEELRDPLVWVKSEAFVLSPGMPIPIIACNASDWAMQTLSDKNLAFQVVFTSTDDAARRMAVARGVGLMAYPSRMVPETLTEANDYYLPKLSEVRTILVSRRDLLSPKAVQLQNKLSSLFFRNEPLRDDRVSMPVQMTA